MSRHLCNSFSTFHWQRSRIIIWLFAMDLFMMSPAHIDPLMLSGTMSDALRNILARSAGIVALNQGGVIQAYTKRAKRRPGRYDEHCAILSHKLHHEIQTSLLCPIRQCVQGCTHAESLFSGLGACIRGLLQW